MNREFLGYGGELSRTQVSDKLRRAACTFVRETLQNDLKAKMIEFMEIAPNRMQRCVLVTGGMSGQDFADMCQAMKEQEIENGRWNGLSSDVVACNDCFKVKDFRKLFVAAWFIYYSTVLGVEHNATPGQSSFLS